jgi:hypothetical protein
VVSNIIGKGSGFVMDIAQGNKRYSTEMIFAVGKNILNKHCPASLLNSQ